MSDREIVILDGARTPMAEYNGAFADVTAIDLGAHAAAEAMKRSGVSPSEIDHVIFGNALQTSGDAIYGARHVGLKAGVPVETPALTTDWIPEPHSRLTVSAGTSIGSPALRPTWRAP